MHALLMCGGRGKRLGRGEKPLLEVCGMKLIEHALMEFKNFEVIAVTSPNTPQTEKFLLENGVEVYRSLGKGFIEDYREACLQLSIKEPVFIASADIVYLKRGIPERAVKRYMKSNKMALKVMMSGKPVGLNIIDARFIDKTQEEEIYNIEKNSIVNVNTLKDVERAEELWIMMKKEKGLQKG